MKKLLTLGLLAVMTMPAWAQGDLLVGKSVYVLGTPLTWTNANGTYTFDPSIDKHDLSKLTKNPRNTDDVLILPQNEAGGGFMATVEGIDYEAINKAVGIQGFYVDMESTQTVESVYTTWEGAFGTAYDIYLTANVPDKANLGTPAYSGTGLNGTEQTVNLSGNNTGRYLVFQTKDATNWGWGCKIRSISAYGDTKSVTSLSVEAGSVKAGSTITVTVIPLNVVGDALDVNAATDYSLACSDPSAVEITNLGSGKFSVKGVMPGSYTLSATAKYNGNEVSGETSFNVTYDWSVTKNIAAGKKVYYRWKEDGEVTTNTGDKVTDQNIDTYYEYNGDWGGGDGWIVIDLGQANDFVVDAVEVYFIDNNNNATGANTFKLSFGTSQAVVPTDDAVWSPGENWYTTATMDKSAGAFIPYTLSQEEKIPVRYIAYLDGNNSKGKPMIGEIYVAGTEMKEAPVAKEVTLSSNLDYVATDEKVVFTPLVIDQYGSVMPDAEVVINVNNAAIEGFEYTPAAVGNYTVVAKSGTIISEPLTLHVIAKAENKINKGGETTSIEYAASKGDSGLETNPFTQETQWAKDEFGTPLVITFDSPVELELLKFNWEAACPSDYSIIVTRQLTKAADDMEETIMKVSGRSFIMGTNPVDRLYHDPKANGEVTLVGNSVVCGANLSGIKTMKVVPTDADHNYNLRLFNIDAIGTQEFIDTSAVKKLQDYISGEGVDVISIQGVMMKRGVNASDALNNLPKGIYIIRQGKDSKKVVVR